MRQAMLRVKAQTHRTRDHSPNSLLSLDRGADSEANVRFHFHIIEEMTCVCILSEL